MTTIDISTRVYDGGPASLQRYFDETIEHLVTQGKQAMNGSLSCRYRTEGGESCAVGCHIPDEHYSTNLEGTTITKISGVVADIFEPLSGIAFPDSREGLSLATVLYLVDLYEWLSLLTPEHIERLKIADALESGLYSQARSVLRQHLSTGDSHCCLGVGCDLSDYGRWAEPSHVYGTHVRYEFGDLASVDSMPPDDLKVRWFGDTNDAETTAGMMAGLNDYNTMGTNGDTVYPWGFPEIAKLFRLNGKQLDEAVDFHQYQGGYQERTTWIERFPFLALDGEVKPEPVAANFVLGDE